MGRS
ncbi:hypothetical protein LINGRAPRIM_LOCUS3267 [Linum grandiflorum]|jgi:hypothetical protein